jgi:hypothetical protein
MPGPGFCFSKISKNLLFNRAKSQYSPARLRRRHKPARRQRYIPTESKIVRQLTYRLQKKRNTCLSKWFSCHYFSFIHVRNRYWNQYNARFPPYEPKEALVAIRKWYSHQILFEEKNYVRLFSKIRSTKSTTTLLTSQMTKNQILMPQKHFAQRLFFRDNTLPQQPDKLSSVNFRHLAWQEC